MKEQFEPRNVLGKSPKLKEEGDTVKTKNGMKPGLRLFSAGKAGSGFVPKETCLFQAP